MFVCVRVSGVCVCLSVCACVCVCVCVCSCVSDSSLSVDLFCIDMCVVCVCADQIYIISAAVLQVLSRTLRYSRGRLPAPWLGSTR